MYTLKQGSTSSGRVLDNCQKLELSSRNKSPNHKTTTTYFTVVGSLGGYLIHIILFEIYKIPSYPPVRATTAEQAVVVSRLTDVNLCYEMKI